MTENIFSKTSRIEASPAAVFEWHARPGALERLTPPWESMRIIQRSVGIQAGARVFFTLKTGPLYVPWHAEHTDYRKNEMFRDRQVKGPFHQWIHTHLFHPDGENGCLLEDIIAYKLHLAPLSDLVAGGFVRRKLERMFAYRHETTRLDIAAHEAAASAGSMHILISGASGLVGSTLIPFLTTGGHQVTRLVRRVPIPGNHEVFWDPTAGKLDPQHLQGIDAVIHLAGENIGEGRWTQAKKRKIMASRIQGTSLLAETLARLDPPPKVLICASAIGYYGHRGECLVQENDEPGKDYISLVCSEWENAAQSAVQRGIRVVFARIGIALTPAGGALKKLLPVFAMGLGGKIASGEQYMSWISMDDVIGALHHLLTHPDVEGPVNLTAPSAVTNAEFTHTLADVLSRPAVFTVPAFAIKTIFGEMGKEVPLSSTRVAPTRLLESGYHFRYPHLKEALSHELGIGCP